ncbi:MAG: HAD hydrolase-like protein [Bacilli bacterium]|jgi:phosphoglycolate phosphatase|nr:HAD hydrolase-like protein [Bacilli bacterium]
MIKALAFDLDGTLADTLPDLAEGVNFSLKMNGFPLHPEEEYLSFIGNGSKVLIQKSLPPQVDEKTFKKVFDDYLTYYLSHVCVKSRAFEGMKETLSEVKRRGIRLFCLTNKPEEAAKKLIVSLYDDLFSQVIGIREGVKVKPDAAMMEIIFKEQNLKPEEVAYFGDSDVDLLFAHNSKVKYAIGVGWGYRPLKELIDLKPYKIIYRPSEILDLDFLKDNK